MGAPESEVRDPCRGHAAQGGRGTDRLDAEAMPVLTRRKIKVEFEAERGSSLVLEAVGAAKSYGEREVLKPFDLEIRHGERVGIVGRNGAGKTTLFKMALGPLSRRRADIPPGPSIVVGYYAQEQETLDPNHADRGRSQDQARHGAAGDLDFWSGLLFDRDRRHESRFGNLSGGERSRLQIATLILKGANFLLLDEPTNNLDIASVEALEMPCSTSRDDPDRSRTTAFIWTGSVPGLSRSDTGILSDYPGGFSYYQANTATKARVS